ncbi:MAG: PatA/PatG family cyanobactin maturation protease, partial [Microcystaceae cyanobacterium]
IFGQPGSPVEGIAPNCTGIDIPIAFDSDNFINPLNLSRAINLALDKGANIIHIAACHPTQTGVAHELLEKAIRQCQDNNILIVAPGGNDRGESWCIPAVLPHVLSVGAMKDSGEPFKFSNWGGKYQEQGVLAPGENILGAQPGTDKPICKKGTSCAAPVVTGIAALLMSLQLQHDVAPDAEAVRAAITNSAIACDPDEVEEAERCLRGKLNVPGAYKLLTGENLESVSTSDTVHPDNQSEDEAKSQEVENPQNLIEIKTIELVPLVTVAEEVNPSNLEILPISEIAPSQATNGVTPSQKSDLVYALGTLGYDFGTEARRDTFKQFMPVVEIDGTTIPANPYDARQIVDYLEENLFEAKSLIWTLNLELTPIYAIEPKG